MDGERRDLCIPFEAVKGKRLDSVCTDMHAYLIADYEGREIAQG